MTQTPDTAAAERRRRRPTSARIWNRRIHNYVGLYFLVFIWLFALSGLLLNHSDWTFAEFWPSAKNRPALRSCSGRRPRAIWRSLET